MCVMTIPARACDFYMHMKERRIEREGKPPHFFLFIKPLYQREGALLYCSAASKSAPFIDSLMAPQRERKRKSKSYVLLFIYCMVIHGALMDYQGNPSMARIE